ncbi:hypothetical protein DEU56DRAFT_729372 [Suillus clintonianus]|uniref:uncharacterized protein n=1 Tax=Suillus clintonianus TaxID=1904413 RepID=UPI001B85C4DF|nr:uncharacterized protein DEU56DRAFT_729372 [Suillus clintonianus]KAG2149347.1 hypothetical protein DEU56DRAFT_729372 [Suillus clintonianus]
MSKRLASFHGPSTPTSSPVSQVKKSVTPASPSRASDASIHRKFRTLLHELRSIANTWDDIVLVDGLKAARTLVDSRTELDNALAMVPADTQPGSLMVGPKLDVMDGCITLLDSVLMKLSKLLRRMSSVLDNMEALMFEAEKLKGFQWCHEEPLWISWPIEKFVLSLSELTTPYHRSLALHKELVDILRSHTVSFEDSRSAINQWVEQPFLRDDGWDAKWEDLCEAEVEKWDTR